MGDDKNIVHFLDQPNLLFGIGLDFGKWAMTNWINQKLYADYARRNTVIKV